ncbi:MAG: type III pantothenate kinase [Moraxellaceae bacterium]|nr:type III pantothenate kinase [Moraxellaceae bacterium]
MALVYYFDVGNTRLKIWACDGDSLIAEAAIAHDGIPAAALASVGDAFARRPDAICGASVIGGDEALALAAQARWGLAPLLCRARQTQMGVVNAYGDAYALLGIDRWLGLLAVHGYGDDRPICIVDCGTAMTVDILLPDGRHVGGYILPGLDMMASALLAGTVGVRFTDPQIDSLQPGLGTGQAVQHGVLLSAVALIDRLQEQWGAGLVLTGGDAPRVLSHIMGPCRYEPTLLLQGMKRYFADAGIC